MGTAIVTVEAVEVGVAVEGVETGLASRPRLLVDLVIPEAAPEMQLGIQRAVNRHVATQAAAWTCVAPPTVALYGV